MFRKIKTMAYEFPAPLGDGDLFTVACQLFWQCHLLACLYTNALRYYYYTAFEM
jgi:hypothetical protein